MEVERKNDINIRFGTLNPGDSFDMGGAIHIKTDEMDSDGDIMAVQLSNGCTIGLHSSTLIIPVKAKVIVEG